MTETITAATSARTAKRTTWPLGLPKDAMPNFDLPKIEVPVAFRELAEKGVAEAKENYEKIQAAAEEMTSALEETCSTAAKGLADYNLKLMEMARANTTAAFEFGCGLLAMKSLPEMVQHSTEQARKQFELITAQNKELWTLAQKMAAATAEPVKQSVTKAFNRIGRS
jgi:phasin